MGGLGFQLEELQDSASPAVRRFADGLRPSAIKAIAGRSAANTVREHLFGLNLTRPNQLGGARTNYYATAARSTHFTIVADYALISITQIGINQRYYGGTIKPKVAKFLTIPVNPKAYGHRAAEFDLELVFGRNGEPVALALKGTRTTSIRQNKSGKVQVTSYGHRAGEIMFRLARSVTQQPDPGILPHDDLINTRVQRDVNSYVTLLIARASSGGAS